MNSIAIIDNNEIDRLITQKMFEYVLPNINLQFFSSASKALEKLKNNNSELGFILLEPELPGLDGWELLDAIAGLSIEVPIYIFSYAILTEDEQKAKAKANPVIKGFIWKPIDTKAITQLAAIHDLS